MSTTATKHASINYLTLSHRVRVTSLISLAEHRQVGWIIWPDKTYNAVYSLKFHLKCLEDVR